MKHEAEQFPLLLDEKSVRNPESNEIWKRREVDVKRFWSKVKVGHSLQLKLGRILKKGEKALHTCDNPDCVNPNHIFLGSAKDNTQDMIKKGRNRPPHKLNPSIVRQIRDDYTNGGTLRSIGNRLRINYTTVAQIVKGKTWKSVGGPILAGTDMRKHRCGGWPTSSLEKLVCVICGKDFLRGKRRANATCSKRCGGIKGHQTRRLCA